MSKKRIQIQDPAPDFTLNNQEGHSVSLTDYLGQSPIVLFFYPKDDSPGCTAQVCSFRDAYSDFQQLGAVVIGISSDSEQSHASFISKHKLPFILLSDTNGKVRKEYGISSTLGMIPGRVTFIIDLEGRIRHIFNSQFQPKKHIEQSLKIIRQMQESPSN